MVIDKDLLFSSSTFNPNFTRLRSDLAEFSSFWKKVHRNDICEEYLREDRNYRFYEV